MSTFGERLQALREKRRPAVKRHVMSERYGWGHEALRRYERDESEPTLSRLKQIAQEYNVGLDDFCWDEGERGKEG